MTQTIHTPGYEPITVRFGAFIDGTYHSPTGGGAIPSTNPANGQVLAEIADCRTKDVDVAVASGRQAFDSGVWRNRSPSERKNVLLKFADLIDSNSEELALLESLEIGKPIRDTTNIDIPKSSGNSVVLKPAEQSSLTALRAAELAIEAGLPSGVLNVVTGTGPHVGRAMGLHRNIDMIAFTGSSEIAKAFLVYAG